MKDLSHTEVQKWLVNGEPLSDEQAGRLQAHLAGCEPCERFAAVTRRLSEELPASLAESAFSLGELHGRAQMINAAVERKSMKTAYSEILKTAGWTAAAAGFLLVLSLVFQMLIPRGPQPGEPGTGGEATATPRAMASATAEVEPMPTAAAELPGAAGSPGLLVYESTRDGNAEIYTAVVPGGPEISARVERNLTQHPANDGEPAWSPDGRLIAFVSDRSGYGDVFVMNSDGGDVRQLTDLGTTTMMPANAEIRFRHLAWSPDGSQIAASLGNNLGGDVVEPLYLIAVDGSGVRALTDGTDLYPAWSPDGMRLAFTRLSDSQGQAAADIFIVNRDGSGLENVSKGDSWTDGEETGPATWAADGARLAFSSMGPDGLRLMWMVPGNSPTVLGFPAESQAWDGKAAWSPAENRLAYLLMAEDPFDGLYLLDDAQGLLMLKISDELEGANDLAWDASGGWMAVTMPSPSGESQIHLIRLDAAGMSRGEAHPYTVFPLTFSGNNMLPRWQPVTQAPAAVETGALMEVRVAGSEQVNCRSGPGTTFEVVSLLPGGTTGTATGVSGNGEWVWVVVRDVGACWVYAPLLESDSPLDGLPVLTP